MSIHGASTFAEDHGHHPEISNTQKGTAGDIEKAFLNVSVTKEDRDVLSFLWFDDVKKRYPEVIVTICPSNRSEEEDPEFVETFLRSIYVDDLSSGGTVHQI